MDGCNPTAELQSSLTELEASLTAPVVPGELPDWIKRVDEVWCHASEQIHHHTTEFHERQYQEIAAQDPELLNCIEHLQLEDQAIDEQRDGVGRTVARVTHHAPSSEPDEQKLRQQTDRLKTDGIALVNRVRTQEAALQTWFIEAFNRDRGVVD
ncbi:MAG TPA: hypothetical protein VGM76_07115 [Lacipirellulaceae bacterium]|jgi:hypothetical protein